MGLVNVNCPNCGASVQLSDEQNRAFCMFCGGQIQVQEAIQKIKIDKSGELENLLMLTKEDLKTGDFEMAQQRVQKALEIDATNPEAWLLNMYASSAISFNEEGEMQTTIAVGEGTAFSSILRSGENTIKYSNDNIEYRKKVNECFISRCLLNLCLARDCYADVSYIHARLQELEVICYPGQIAHWGQHDHEEAMFSEDIENLNLIASWEDIAFNLLDKVDTELLDNDNYEQLAKCADTYKRMISSLDARLGLYNQNTPTDIIKLHKERLEKIYNMIPQSYKDSKNIATNEVNYEKRNSGCSLSWGGAFLIIIIMMIVGGLIMGFLIAGDM